MINFECTVSLHILLETVTQSSHWHIDVSNSVGVVPRTGNRKYLQIPKQDANFFHYQIRIH